MLLLQTKSEVLVQVVPEPVDCGLSLMSLVAVSIPKRNRVKIVVRVDGKKTTILHNGGADPVHAICNALRTSVPGFIILHCMVEESGPGSDATAHVCVGWGGHSFDGEATSPNKLEAIASAIIEVLNRLRLIQWFARGCAPKLVDGLWAGFLCNEPGGCSGTGGRQFALFDVSFVLGRPRISFKKMPDAKLKADLSKNYFSGAAFWIVEYITDQGDRCQLFIAKHRIKCGGREHCQL